MTANSEFNRSDTHDTLNCERCEAGDSDCENTRSNSEPSATIAEDIGEFAKVAGCSERLMPWERQVRISGRCNSTQLTTFIFQFGCLKIACISVEFIRE